MMTNRISSFVKQKQVLWIRLGMGAMIMLCILFLYNLFFKVNVMIVQLDESAMVTTTFSPYENDTSSFIIGSQVQLLLDTSPAKHPIGITCSYDETVITYENGFVIGRAIGTTEFYCKSPFGKQSNRIRIEVGEQNE